MKVSRRRMIAGASAVGAGVVAAAVAGAGPAQAAPGGPVVQGAVNDAGTTTTTLTSNVEAGGALVVNNNMKSSGYGDAVQAAATYGSAVKGTATRGNGVNGYATTGNGVSGGSNSGFGVVGYATGNGASGVVASASDAYSIMALDVRGPAKFRRSGVVSVPAGATWVTVTSLAIFSYTHALATCQLALGVAVSAAVPDPAAGTLKIVLTGPAPTLVVLR